MSKPWEKKRAALERFLIRKTVASNPRLQKAMWYSVGNGGKRLRPWLVFQWGQVFGIPEKDLLSVAAAVEFVHSSSLIHDDLPALDNSLERRNHPSCWKAFDEPTAILAGDALLIAAFEVLNPPSLIPKLAEAAGAKGMMSGQMLDLFPSQSLTFKDLCVTNALKTGNLIAFCCTAPAIIAGKNSRTQSKLYDFGLYLGLLYQLTDDYLDKDEDSTVTWAHVCSPQEATHRAEAWYVKASKILQEFNEHAHPIQDFLYWVRHRIDFYSKT